MDARLWIGGPTRDSVPASFAFDLAHLYSKTRERVYTVLRFVGATYVHVGREWVLDQALKHRMTHLLWLDTDMGFPPETALRLLAHDVPVVGANCVLKRQPPTFTAVRDGARVVTGPESTGLESVDSVGLAVLLLRLDVVAALPRPWFRHGVNDDGSDVGEDIMFCRALRRAGHDVFIDHDLSRAITHVGQFAYGTDSSTCAVTV